MLIETNPFTCMLIDKQAAFTHARHESHDLPIHALASWKSGTDYARMRIVHDKSFDFPSVRSRNDLLVRLHFTSQVAIDCFFAFLLRHKSLYYRQDILGLLNPARTSVTAYHDCLHNAETRFDPPSLEHYFRRAGMNASPPILKKTPHSKKKRTNGEKSEPRK